MNFSHNAKKIGIMLSLPFQILNFIKQNITVLEPEWALLLTASQSYILLFQYNFQGSDL